MLSTVTLVQSPHLPIDITNSEPKCGDSQGVVSSDLPTSLPPTFEVDFLVESWGLRILAAPFCISFRVRGKSEDAKHRRRSSASKWSRVIGGIRCGRLAYLISMPLGVYLAHHNFFLSLEYPGIVFRPSLV